MREAKEGLTPSLGPGWCLEQGGWLWGDGSWITGRQWLSFTTHFLIQSFSSSTSSLHRMKRLPFAHPYSPVHPSAPCSVPREAELHQGAPVQFPPALRKVWPMGGAGEKWEGREERGSAVHFLASSVLDCRLAVSLHQRSPPSLTVTLADSLR